MFQVCRENIPVTGPLFGETGMVNRDPVESGVRFSGLPPTFRLPPDNEPYIDYKVLHEQLWLAASPSCSAKKQHHYNLT